MKSMEYEEPRKNKYCITKLSLHLMYVMIYTHVVCGANQNLTHDFGNVSNSVKDSEYTLDVLPLCLCPMIN